MRVKREETEQEELARLRQEIEFWRTVAETDDKYQGVLNRIRLWCYIRYEEQGQRDEATLAVMDILSDIFPDRGLHA